MPWKSCEIFITHNLFPSGLIVLMFRKDRDSTSAVRWKWFENDSAVEMDADEWNFPIFRWRVPFGGILIYSKFQSHWKRVSSVSYGVKTMAANFQAAQWVSAMYHYNDLMMSRSFFQAMAAQFPMEAELTLTKRLATSSRHSRTTGPLFIKWTDVLP